MIGFFAMIACGAMLAQQCLYDPATYLQPRTVGGCHEFVRLMVAETNGWRVPKYECVEVGSK